MPIERNESQNIRPILGSNFAGCLDNYSSPRVNHFAESVLALSASGLASFARTNWPLGTEEGLHRSALASVNVFITDDADVVGE